jgi:CRP/FNR family transcriptional regulator
MDPNTLDHIAGVPLFDGLPERHLRDLASIAISRSFTKGRTIFSEDERANGFHVVRSGTVKVFKLSAEGKEQILHIFGPGEPFGEVPVFEGGRFPAYAIALDPVTTHFFPREAFVGLLKSTPDLALNMLAVLSRRLRGFTNLIDALSLKEVPGRLAGHLLALSAAQGGADRITLDVPKNQLASILGTIPETLSRILGKMTHKGYIVAEGNAILIRDRNALQELADGRKRLS